MKKKSFIWISAAVLLLCAAAFLLLRCPHQFGEEIPVGKGKDGYTFARVCTECGKEELIHYDALLTFVDDDAKMQAMLHWERIIDETGITMTAALIPGKIEETTDYDCWWAYAGWDLLERMQSKGVDFVNHTYSHQNLTTFTEEELHQDLSMAKAELARHGIESDILVYPFNAYNDLVISVVDDYFDAAFTRLDQVITEPVGNDYKLSRMNLNDYSVTKTIEFASDTIVECYGVKPVETLKKDLEKAIDQQGWLVYVAHAYDSPGGKYFFDEVSEQSVIDFCRYVQGLDRVKIVNLTTGVAASADLLGD